MGVSWNDGTPKSSILIGFSIIFTIHFGGFPYFWKHPNSKGTDSHHPIIPIIRVVGGSLAWTLLRIAFGNLAIRWDQKSPLETLRKASEATY